MIDTNFSFDLKDMARENFENIKKAIQGLFEILHLSLPSDDIYYQMGQDNLMALYKNLLELLTNDYGTRHLMKEIKTADVNLNLSLKGLKSSDHNDNIEVP